MGWMELADYLFAVAAGGVGVLAGYRWAAYRHRRRRPMCTCEHGYGNHDETTGVCGGWVTIASAWLTNGRAVKWRQIACPCRHYDGPNPMLLDAGMK
jgi:hypothetical protein